MCRANENGECWYNLVELQSRNLVRNQWEIIQVFLLSWTKKKRFIFLYFLFLDLFCCCCLAVAYTVIVRVYPLGGGHETKWRKKKKPRFSLPRTTMAHTPAYTFTNTHTHTHQPNRWITIFDPKVIESFHFGRSFLSLLTVCARTLPAIVSVPHFLRISFTSNAVAMLQYGNLFLRHTHTRCRAMSSAQIHRISYTSIFSYRNDIGNASRERMMEKAQP